MQSRAEQRRASRGDLPPTHVKVMLRVMRGRFTMKYSSASRSRTKRKEIFSSKGTPERERGWEGRGLGANREG